MFIDATTPTKEQYFEKIQNDFVKEFMEEHHGNYTEEDIKDGFYDGYHDRPAPKGTYHGFLAWQAGQRWGGWK